jgi:DNA-binding SARP family transcriptional activator
MRVRLLGPIDVMSGGEVRPVSGLRRKAVLATLALHAGEVVSTGRLVDAVWGEAAPAALNTLQSHVSYLRTVVGKAAIVARPPGYLLDLGEDGTDLQRAERLLRQGAQSADAGRRAADLREALALWRGRPLADLAGLAWLEQQAERLDLLREQIRHALSEARLDAGEHRQLIPELEQMAADHPLDEQVHARLMTALYRSGRQADALALYQQLRATLADELGLAPSLALRELETAILRQDAALDASAPALSLRPAAPPPPPVPAQLPPPVAAFAGRDAELARLDAILDGQEPDDASAVTISAITGTAGVGKTALAVHWAHRVAARFPGGQLYVDLRGFDPAGPALDPGQALRGFFEAFAVPPERVPAGLDDQVALYRSLLAGQRVLVVLDNARDAGQVRPLLPGSPGCLAIVTSRNHLAGLIAGHGAHPLGLDLLTPEGARELIARRVGAGRAGREPGAVDEIVVGCARLPLALTIAAARAATNPRFPLAVFAADLREAGHALDPFGGDDAATDIRAVFSWSYRSLNPDTARMFRLLGLHPGPDMTVGAAASLAGIAPDRARALLAELTRGHLLSERRPGRYGFHDLLRAYATEQARDRDDDVARGAAVGRLLDHWLHIACAAAALLDPFFAPEPAEPPLPRVVLGAPATAEEALRWFAAEHATLQAGVSLAARSGLAGHAWRLTWALSTFLLRRGCWDYQARACRAALDAARRAGDVAGEAHALLLLALGDARSGRRDASPQFRESLRLLEAIGGYHRSRATGHSSLIWIAEQQERYGDMLDHAVRALGLARASGDQTLEIMSLNDVGYSHARLGNYGQAVAYCGRALAGSRAAGERNWESAAWDSLGYIHHKLADHQRAITCYERSLDLCRELADRYNEAGTLDRLGDVHHSAGDARAARWAWTQALRLLDELRHPDSDRVRAKTRVPGNRLPAVI